MRKKLILFLTAVFTAAAFFGSGASGYAAPAATETVVVFTSDVHHTSTSGTTSSASRLKEHLQTIAAEYGAIDALGVCGDLGCTVTGNTYWKYVKAVMDNVSSLGLDAVYTTGNHEQENGRYSTTTNATAKLFIRLGPGKSASDYEIYCLGAASTTMEFPESDIEALSAYLKTIGTEKPVFILSHFPLHWLKYTEGGSEKIRAAGNRDKVIALLNQYPNTFFIWGHNHSKNDPNYNQIITDKIQTDETEFTDISFTYASAGAMTEPSENTWAGNIASKELIAIIGKDGKNVALRYLDKEYGTVAEWTNETEDSEPAVVLYSRLEGTTDRSVANIEGGGKISRLLGGTVSAPEETDCFEFAGWYGNYTGQTADSTLYSEEASVLVKTEEDLELTAVYRAKQGSSCDVSVSGDGYTPAGGEALTGTNSFTCSPGDLLTLTFTAPFRDFMFWQDGEGRVLGRAATLSLTVTRDLSVTACSVPRGEARTHSFVCYLDSEANLLCARFLSVTDTFSAPGAPELPGMTFVAWSLSPEEIQEAMTASRTVTVTPVYQSLPE